MRIIAWTFVLLSPLIAVARISPDILPPALHTQLATATASVTTLVHAIQTLFT